MKVPGGSGASTREREEVLRCLAERQEWGVTPQNTVASFSHGNKVGSV